MSSVSRKSFLTEYPISDNFSREENEIAHERWCNDLAAKILCIFVLDRFSDFVTDQVCFSSETRGVKLTTFEGGCPRPGNSFTDACVPAALHASSFSDACAFSAPADDPAGLCERR